MKGTLLSFDFVKDQAGDLKFLEMNTDTTISQVALDNDIDWNPLFNVMTASNATEIDVIFKPQIHQHIVNHLSASVISDANFVTAFRTHEEDFYNVFPTAVTDAPEKFILRLAYDDNAIVDNTYCATGHAALSLLNEYNSSSLAVPFYYSGSAGEVDLLQTSSNDAYLPDLAIKTKRDSVQGLKFVKVQDWSTVKSNFADTHYLMNYVYYTGSMEDVGGVWNGVASSYRHYAIAYGGGLEAAHIGTFQQYAQFDIPGAEALAYSGSSNNILANKHYYEYSTSTPKTRYAYEGLYFTDKYVSASSAGEPLSAEDIQVGTALKSFHIPGSPDTDDPKLYLDWSLSGKTLPEGFAITSSIATAAPRVAQDRLGNVLELKPSGSTPVYLGINTSIITYNTGSDSYAYRGVQTINKEKDFLVNTSGNLLPIEEMNFVVLHQPTGSFFTVDIENTDNLVADTDNENDILISFHNPPQKLEPPK